MNKREFRELQAQADKPQRLRGDMLANRSPRTLVYGVTHIRHTFHVYIADDQKLHLVTYDDDGFLQRHQTEADLEPGEYEPTKYAYPEACDFEFTSLLQGIGVDLTFLPYQEREDARFYGQCLDELVVIPESHTPARIRITAGEIDLPAHSVFRTNEDKRKALTREMHMLVNSRLEKLNRLFRYRGKDVRAQLEEIPARVQQFVRTAAAELSAYEMPEKVKARMMKEMTQHVYG